MGQAQGRIEVKDITILKNGDHIYSDRKDSLLLYYHHGIYVGNNLVIHFQPKGGKINPSGPLPAARRCDRCGYKPNEGGGVVKTCLYCFAKGNSLYIYEYGVDMSLCLKKPAASCTWMHARSADDVVRTATELLHGNGFGNYNFALNNCEDFAVYCKTGLPVSQQVEELTRALPGEIGRPIYVAAKVIRRVIADRYNTEQP